MLQNYELSSIGATIGTCQDILCLPYAGFLVNFKLDTYITQDFVIFDEFHMIYLSYLNSILHMLLYNLLEDVF